MMEVDPETFQDNLLKFLGESPTFELGQKQRYIYFHDLSKKLEKMKTVFSNYRVQYASLQQKLTDIEEALTGVSEFSAPLRNCRFQVVTNGIKDSINVYLKVFDDYILNPVIKFINSLEDMEFLNTVADENHTNFEDAYDKFMQESNTNSKAYLTKQSNLIDAHKYASSTFVNFYNKLEEITIDMKTLPSLIVAGFIEAHNQQAESLNSILIKNNNNLIKHATLLEIIKSDKEKQKSDAHKLESSVCGILPNYWNRFSTPFKGTTRLTIQGWLYKRGKRFSSWQRRFVVVSNGFLSYGANVDDYMRDPTTINLVLCSVRYEKDSQRPNCFSITSPDEIRVFECVSQYDLDRWISIIESNIMSAINNSGKRKTQDVARNSTILMKPAHSLRFECADCKSCDATWITLNWCQHLCSKCSGVHRSLGPTISRVRSIVLDTIHPWPLKVFEKLSTSPTNQFLEYKVEDRDKITASSSNEKREEYIRKKYVDLAFADDRPKDYNIFEAIEEGDLFKVFKCVATGDHKTGGDYLPIHAAAIQGDALVLTLIAMNMNNLDEADNGGWTALIYAVYYDNEECVNCLIDLGSDPEKSSVPLWKCAKAIKSQHMMTKFPPPSPELNNEENIEITPPHGPKSAPRKRFLTNTDLVPPMPSRPRRSDRLSAVETLHEFAKKRRYSYNQVAESD